ncbi:PhoH family protein [bacterium]|jgi:phosphate starvation-inducible PhoH-like protein|nr:PhoH family protein [bacterium]MDC1007264.1 PhoH family protein [bacterium]
MGAKRKAKTSQKNFNNNNVVELNSFTKKKQSVTILPRNKNQEQYVLKLLEPTKDIVFGIGPAGTGKTLLAVQVAVKLFKEGKVDKIIVTRPAVSVDEDLGHLPGTLEQKMAPWTRPIFDVLREYFNAREIEGMIEEGIIEIAPLAYMRGRTFKHSFILADEMQNATPNQMKMLLTRLGTGAMMAVTGDLNQADRLRDNGLIDFTKLLQNNHTSHLDIVQFERGDIERHEAVKEVLHIYGDD